MLALYAHPFASFCWKVVIALYERDLAFEYRQVDDAHPEHAAALKALWPVGQFPVLVDGDVSVIESSVIVEHLDLHHGAAPPMIPRDAKAALAVRMFDRVVDDYVQVPMQRIVADFIRVPADRDPLTVEQATATLQKAYGWLETQVAGRTWAVGETFSLADAAAAPALFYADWVVPIGEDCPSLRAYRARLLARPSVARVVDAARPWRRYFPPGAPDRD